jgi:hypothetical protein
MNTIKKRALPTNLNVLGSRKRFLLTQFVSDYYVSKAMSDVDFATHAQKELGFEVTNHNVAGARKTLELPSTKFSKKPLKSNLNGEVRGLLSKLEGRLRLLELQMANVNIKLRSLSNDRNKHVQTVEDL